MLDFWYIYIYTGTYPNVFYANTCVAFNMHIWNSTRIGDLLGPSVLLHLLFKFIPQMGLLMKLLRNFAYCRI